MDNFGFPSNIKQIGNVDSNMRIYIEDNVYTYLLKYAECNKNKESLAMLVGRPNSLSFLFRFLFCDLFCLFYRSVFFGFVFFFFVAVIFGF